MVKTLLLELENRWQLRVDSFKNWVRDRGTLGWFISLKPVYFSMTTMTSIIFWPISFNLAHQMEVILFSV